ncbi:MAG: hypothetical protein NC253_05880 [Ruminococcus sp.]|nr:hypothetical protein [Ruminococcus sp.]MCM1381264.1 hypothetical protein [Muribaculaceae bacterium]MCM1478615.1 hypothetical protein [Muribaculaceae bacterium]
MKKSGINKSWIASVTLFALIAAWLLISVGNAGKSSDKNRAEALKKSVMNGAALCYSIEGEYPKELSYLEENYGVNVGSDIYIVHYEYFGANVSPTVTVIEKGEKS